MTVYVIVHEPVVMARMVRGDRTAFDVWQAIQDIKMSHPYVQLNDPTARLPAGLPQPGSDLAAVVGAYTGLCADVVRGHLEHAGHRVFIYRPACLDA